MKLFAALMVVAIVGCSPVYESGKTKCSDKKECPSGFTCLASGYCVDNSGGSGSGGNSGTSGGSGGTSGGISGSGGTSGGISGSGGTSGGGSSGGGVPSTLGGVCNETGAAFCQSEVRCTTVITQSQCVTLFVQSCCQNSGTCNDLVPGIDASLYSRCKSDLSTMSCTDVSNESLPSSCSSI
jgi:hypothetical protein